MGKNNNFRQGNHKTSSQPSGNPFVNPYTFIPFGENIEDQRTSRENQYRNDEKKLVSGWLDIKLDTKTPLVIPDGAHPKYWDDNKKCYVENPTDEEKKKLHKEYAFFKVPDENGDMVPAVPGSSLHGMVRSVYEAVTDSCISFTLDEDAPISQRLPLYGSLQKRGLLAYEPIDGNDAHRQWVLYSTFASLMPACFDTRSGKLSYKDGTPVTEKNGSYQEGNGWIQYNYPVNKYPRTNRDGKTEYYHIAYLQPDEAIKIWNKRDSEGNWDKEYNEEPYRALKSALERDSASGKNSNEVPFRNLLNALLDANAGKGNLVPVYYFTVKRGTDTLVYMSNSAIGRIAQRRKWSDIMGLHKPCDSSQKLCPACLLFGTLIDEKDERGNKLNNGLKGHVRFTDAMPAGNLVSEIHTLQILGEPRTSAFEMYLRKPFKNATYWNFDYYGHKGYDSKGKEINVYEDLKEATPRGRKMYWHGPVVNDAKYKTRDGKVEFDKNNMNATVEAENGSFMFKVYFDEITEEQLQNLLWVITLGENREDSSLQHKLGHARPLGYGSVKMTVTGKHIRRVVYSDEDMKVSVEYSAVPEHVAHKLKTDNKIIEALLKLCDANAIKSGDGQIMYPWEAKLDRDGNVKEENIFVWFANNHSNANRLQILPEPTDSNISLRGKWVHDPYDPKSEKQKREEYRDKSTGGDNRNSTGHKNNNNVKRLTGKIKIFYEDRDYGFISGDDQKEYYFRIGRDNPHVTAAELDRRPRVSFTFKEYNGRLRAYDCQII